MAVDAGAPSTQSLSSGEPTFSLLASGLSWIRGEHTSISCRREAQLSRAPVAPSQPHTRTLFTEDWAAQEPLPLWLGPLTSRGSL